MEKIKIWKIKRVFNKIPKSLKYLTLLIISILFILEFVIFPPLSAQIEYGSFTYQTEFETYISKIGGNVEIKSNENKFIGTWGTQYNGRVIFKYGGIGTINGYMLWIDEIVETPFTYKIINENTMEMTVEGNNGFDTGLLYYEFGDSGNTLTIKAKKENLYLIRM